MESEVLRLRLVLFGLCVKEICVDGYCLYCLIDD